MYDYYKIARDRAWETLIETKSCKLPIDLTLIAKHYNIEIVRYSKCYLTSLFTPETISGDGFITNIKDKKYIFFNDKINVRGRSRFTVAHELGHGILNHPLKEIISRNDENDILYSDPLEVQANVFARDILAPACVLNALGVTTAKEIMDICDISELSAQIRLERLQELQKRGKFGVSPLERAVLKQFKLYIDEHKIE